MKVTEDLIRRFFADACNEMEADMVISYLNEHPELVELYLPGQEWDEIKTEGVEVEHKEALDRIEAALKLRSGMGDMAVKRKKVFHLLHYCMGAAAVVILLLMVRIWFHNTTVTAGSEIAMNQLVQQGQVLGDTSICNNSGSQSRIVLPDGSVVMLSKNSTVSYERTFERAARDIYLKGKAYFLVAKNKERPFIVHSAGLTTTAVGTSFTVTAFDTASMMGVALYTGKVLIQPDAGSALHMKKVYLVPGQSLNYDFKDGSVVVGKTMEDHSGAEAGISFAAEQIRHSDTQIEFDRIPLSVVFDSLQYIYHLSFEADKGCLEGKSFTGIIKKNLPPQYMLSKIAMINDLAILPVRGGYHISKK